MTRIGVTGHQDLPGTAVAYVAARVKVVLDGQPRPLIGYTSLAAGADQLFAAEMLAAGGSLHVVIPSSKYESTFEGESRKRYGDLLASAVSTRHLAFDAPTEQAFDAAGKWIVQQCELLIAVWDGQPARGLGGTADAVAHARALSRDVCIIWPKGLVRGREDDDE